MSYTVLITGANGFIGSHTTRLIESLGHKVVPIDVVPRSTDLSAKLSSVMLATTRPS